MGLGFGELIVILLIVVIFVGGSKLPALGDALGKSIRNFKKATQGQDEIDVSPKKPEISENSKKD